MCFLFLSLSLSLSLPPLSLPLPLSPSPSLSDELDRKLQAEMTAEILANSTNPIVMLSYITNPPGSRDYWKIVKDGQVKVNMYFERMVGHAVQCDVVVNFVIML